MIKPIHLFFSLLIALQSFSQSVSRNVIAPVGNSFSNSDFSISYTIGQLSNNTLSAINGNTATQGFQQPDGSVLMIKAFLQGYYAGMGLMNSTLFDLGLHQDSTATDSIEVNLWSANALNTPQPSFQKKVLLHNNGMTSLIVPESANGNPYYLAVRHRNSIETWSNSPKIFNYNNEFDLSTSINAAYGDGINPPLKNLGDGNYAIYTGDVNQDGTIDTQDMLLIENDASDFAFGYNITDCNGDGATDLIDLFLSENNSSLFLFFARPF